MLCTFREEWVAKWLKTKILPPSTVGLLIINEIVWAIFRLCRQPHWQPILIKKTIGVSMGKIAPLIIRDALLLVNATKMNILLQFLRGWEALSSTCQPLLWSFQAPPHLIYEKNLWSLLQSLPLPQILFLICRKSILISLFALRL